MDPVSFVAGFFSGLVVAALGLAWLSAEDKPTVCCGTQHAPCDDFDPDRFFDEYCERCHHRRACHTKEG